MGFVPMDSDLLVYTGSDWSKLIQNSSDRLKGPDSLVQTSSNWSQMDSDCSQISDLSTVTQHGPNRLLVQTHSAHSSVVCSFFVRRTAEEQAEKCSSFVLICEIIANHQEIRVKTFSYYKNRAKYKVKTDPSCLCGPAVFQTIFNLLVVSCDSGLTRPFITMSSQHSLYGTQIHGYHYLKWYLYQMKRMIISYHHHSPAFMRSFSKGSFSA